MMRPLIGLTTMIADLELSGTRTRPVVLDWEHYRRAILAAGGLPVFLVPSGDDLAEYRLAAGPQGLQGQPLRRKTPPRSEGDDVGEEVEALLGALHGLILPGGSDLHPALYGEATVHPTVSGMSPARDLFELALVRAALARDLPVLAICRGIQVLNVALGGTLYQDVPDQHPAHADHYQHGAPSEPHHDIRLEPGSCLARTYGAERVAANSFHHQGVSEVAPRLRPVAWSPEGLVEGLESPTHRFVVGVQWHPELMYQAHPEHRQPFTALVAHASSSRERQAVVST